MDSLPCYRIFLHGNICDVNGNKREYSDLNPVNVLHCLPVISSLTHTHWFIISTFCWSKRVNVQSGRLDWPDRTGAGSDCIEPYGEARGLVHVVTLTCLFLCSRHMTDLTCVLNTLKLLSLNRKCIEWVLSSNLYSNTVIAHYPENSGRLCSRWHEDTFTP